VSGICHEYCTSTAPLGPARSSSSIYPSICLSSPSQSPSLSFCVLHYGDFGSGRECGRGSGRGAGDRLHKSANPPPPPPPPPQLFSAFGEVEEVYVMKDKATNSGCPVYTSTHNMYGIYICIYVYTYICNLGRVRRPPTVGAPSPHTAADGGRSTQIGQGVGDRFHRYMHIPRSPFLANDCEAPELRDSSPSPHTQTHKHLRT
jgi:hypothetical protein